jgi:hypothetical protein
MKAPRHEVGQQIMASKVYLDALIPREDFDETDAQKRPAGLNKDRLSITDLVRGEFFISALRKPDFQRETNEWDLKKILDLVESFVAGDLIPAIILWRSNTSFSFVIDGSHRLSALAAWINDDYGDGAISKQFYDGIIPDEQVDIAHEVRNAINKRIGSYSDHKLATTNPDKVKPEIVARAKILATLSIQLQWVNGDSSTAEASFRKINKQGVAINATEMRILEARKKPIGIASRAIIRSGKGHNYWSKFDQQVQTQLQNTAKEINELLFLPKFKSPVATLDLPVAGKIYSSQCLPLIWEFIRIVNPSEKMDEDADGSSTLKFLDNCRKTAQRINSDYASSLGLHPVIYFYAQNGRHKPASFYAITDLIIEFEKGKRFDEFIKIRGAFEDLLLETDYVIQQIVREYRSATASYPQIKEFYLACIQKLTEHKDASTVIDEISRTKDFGYLSKPVVKLPTNPDKDFSRDVKSRTFIKTALEGAPRCPICNGYIHTNSVSVDHKVRKQDGGDASSQNAQITHPYCNTTFKN